MDTYRAYMLVQRAGVKDFLVGLERDAQVERYGTVLVGIRTPCCVKVRDELWERWCALGDREKTQWAELARVATEKGCVRAEPLRQLLKDEPHMMPGTSF